MTSPTAPEQVTAPEWAVDGSNFSRPSIARMYDFLMGGTRHVEKDRDFARDAVAAAPMIKLTIWENRKLIKRVVRELVTGGISQILDVGSGIPARGSVHAVAHAIDPAVKVVYVDMDPVAAARGTELLADKPYCASIQGDLTKPVGILGHPEVLSRLDLTQPVALLFFNVLHFLDKDEVSSALDAYREALAPGSHLAISHGTGDIDDRGVAISQVYARSYGLVAVSEGARVGRFAGSSHRARERLRGVRGQAHPDQRQRPSVHASGHRRAVASRAQRRPAAHGRHRGLVQAVLVDRRVRPRVGGTGQQPDQRHRLPLLREPARTSRLQRPREQPARHRRRVAPGEKRRPPARRDCAAVEPQGVVPMSRWPRLAIDREQPHYARTRLSVCAGQKVLPGFNDLATTNPLLAAQWHSTRNAPLTPRDVFRSTAKRFWWVDVLGHEWQPLAPGPRRAAVTDLRAGTGRTVAAD